MLQPIGIQQHINSLKNNKATDPFGVSAEHLKHADPSDIPTLTKNINNIFSNQDIPGNLKLGIITPVAKKKPKMDPDSYQHITVNFMLIKRWSHTPGKLLLQTAADTSLASKKAFPAHMLEWC